MKAQQYQQYRQGDVLIERVGKLPAGAVELPLEEGRVVLAHGEVTGHAHALPGESCRMFGAGESRFVDVGRFGPEVDRPVAVRHEEHAAIALDPGVYAVIRQREYTPAAIVQVRD